jgi:folate-binding protein YgfZ
MPSTLLSSRGVIALEGPDSLELLQGILTSDVRQLSPETMLHAALLTPQGKMLFDMLLAEKDGCILLECDRARLPELLQRLTMYKLRADVTLKDVSDDMPVYAVWGEDAPKDGFVDPRYTLMGWRCYGDATQLTDSEKDYHAHRLSLGVPEGPLDLMPEKSLVLENRLDALHGVDFTKGCYVGQEVTARSKHRGNVRKKLFIAQGQNLPEPGGDILADGKVVGTMRSSQGEVGLAMLKLDAANETLRSQEGHAIQVQVPPYAR